MVRNHETSNSSRQGFGCNKMVENLEEFKVQLLQMYLNVSERLGRNLLDHIIEHFGGFELCGEVSFYITWEFQLTKYNDY